MESLPPRLDRGAQGRRLTPKPEYFRNGIEMQRGCLDKIYKQFGGKVLPLVPEFDGEIRGMEMIKLMAESMFEEVLE
jgi:hypothetical protein